MVDTVATKSFQIILERVREELGDELFQMWFRSVSLLGLYRGTLTLGVPNVFFREWIQERYAGVLARVAHDVIGSSLRIEVKVDPELFREHRRGMEEEALGEALDLDEPKFRQTLENFVVVPENEFAAGTVRHVIEGGEAMFNPLVIVGPPGCGKSHLLNAFSNCKRNGTTISVGALDFTSRFTMSLKMKTIDGFRESFEGHEVVSIDEVHRLKGKKATQVEFLQLFARLKNRGVQVVMTSRHHPNEIHDISPQLRSIMLSGMMVELLPYSPQALRAIARKHLGVQLRRLDGEVVDAVARGAEGSVKVLRSRLLKLYAYAGLLGESVTPAFAAAHLHELQGDKSGARRDIDGVIDSVCRYFEVERLDLLSKRKTKSLFLPRGLVVAVLRDRYQLTFKDIGKELGGRSHTSVYLMYKKYLPVITDDPELRAFAARIPVGD